MKKILLVIIFLFMMIISSCSTETTVINKVIEQNTTIEDNISIKDLEDLLCNSIELAEQSVVGIISTYDNTLLKSETTGSGVVIKKDSNDYYIITNRHVVVKQGNVCSNVKIYLGTLNILLPCEVVSYDQKVDIALLKLNTEVLLVPAKISDFNLLKKGQFAIAVGSPYSIETYYNTVTVGHISSSQRFIKEDNFYYKEIVNEYIQIDTAINVGCSGGGLFNLEGELIGINAWKLVDSTENIDDMNFAIPINIVYDIFSSYLD